MATMDLCVPEHCPGGRVLLLSAFQPESDGFSSVAVSEDQHNGLS